MKVEQKYLVASIKDIDEALNDTERLRLAALLTKLTEHRHGRGKEDIDAIVIDRYSLGEEAYSNAVEILDIALKEKYCRENGHTWYSGSFEAKCCKVCGHVEY